MEIKVTAMPRRGFPVATSRCLRQPMTSIRTKVYKMQFKFVRDENGADEGWRTAIIPMNVYIEAITGKTEAERDAYLEAWLQVNLSRALINTV